MKTPLVSVCIITYNHELYIRKCLEGVMMQQTDFPFEVIIGEDCSTDRTREVIQEFEAKFPAIIKPIYHESNVGAARNNFEFCFPKFKGKYIAICDGDDYWTDPHKLQKQVDFLEENPGYVMCFHRVASVNAAGEPTGSQEAIAGPVLYDSKDIFHISIPTLSVVYRNCIDSMPGEMYKVKSGDAFLFALLARHGKAADLGFIGAVYRVHSGGIFTRLSQAERFRQAIQTRRLMQQSDLFNKQQRVEIDQEIKKRKILYVKYFIKKYDLRNSLRIMLT